MPIAWRRWGELPQPSLRVSSVTILGSSHPPHSIHCTPRMLKGAGLRPPPQHSLKLAKAGWALTASLPAPCILAVLWEGGIQLLIWEGKQQSCHGKGCERYCYPKAPGRQRASDCRNDKSPA